MESLPQRSYLSLVWRLLIAFVGFAIFPIVVISFIATRGLQEAADGAAMLVDEALAQSSAASLQQRADLTASEIEQFLDQTRIDLAKLSTRSPTADEYLSFYKSHFRTISYPQAREGLDQAIRVDRVLQTFRELQFLDNEGAAQFRVADGNVSFDALGSVINAPIDESELQQAIELLEVGEFYVGPVRAWHTSVDAQPAEIDSAERGPLAGIPYNDYEAVITFATPVVNSEEGKVGTLVAQIDFRHIMEFIVHVDVETEGNTWTVWPDYDSGSYAYLFDHEGYTIAHPLLNRIRGHNAAGELAAATSREELEDRPFNLATWQDDALNKIYADVLAGRRSNEAAVVGNVLNTDKVTVYAPVQFRHGVYEESGVFGGVTIGLNLAAFNRQSDEVRQSAAVIEQRVRTRLLYVSAAFFITSLFTATFTSRFITQPLLQLTAAAVALGDENLEMPKLDSLTQRSWLMWDEVSELASVFGRMAQQIQSREASLRSQVQQLTIQIDEAKKKQVVEAFTESDDFSQLRQDIAKLRERAQNRRSRN